MPTIKLKLIKILFYIVASSEVAFGQCICNGLEVDNDGQKHCLEILSNTGGSYISADRTCQDVGGHLAHPAQLSSRVIDYVHENYKGKPVMTGIILGNVEEQLIALVCPNNEYHSLIPLSNMSLLISSTNIMNNSCTYLTSNSQYLMFDSCIVDSDILCDRPMTQPDYCNIMIFCGTTTRLLNTNTTTSIEATTTILFEDITETITEMSPSTTKLPNKETTIMIPGNNNPDATALTLPTTSSIITTTTSTMKTTAAVPTCQPYSEKTGCGSNELTIFGMCIDWRLLLLIALLVMLINMLCWCIHCLMGMGILKKKNKEVVEPEVQLEEDGIYASNYVNDFREFVDETSVPHPIQSLPVMPTSVLIPTYPEYDVQAPVKEFEEKAVQTDSWNPIKIKRKKKLLKPFTPLKTYPLEEDDEIGDDVSLDLKWLPNSPDLLPKGDPEIFNRNKKPPSSMAYDSYNEDDILSPPKPIISSSPNIPISAGHVVVVKGVVPTFPSPPLKRNPIIPENIQPKETKQRQVESPIIPHKPNLLKRHAPPSPQSIKSPIRINPPSPPIKKQEVPKLKIGNENAVRISPNPKPPSAFKKVSQDEKPFMAPVIERHPTPRKNREARAHSAQPEKLVLPNISATPKAKSPAFFSETPSTPSTRSEKGTSSFMKTPDIPVNIKRARGRLGGVVKAGNPIGPEPTGWKPWGKANDTFSKFQIDE